MLELKSVTWQNFMSYGDYPSTISLDNSGQCLITGEIVDEGDNAGSHSIKKSNGAGKSTIPSAIQWCLFGRTMHSANPGSKVINYFTGRDCKVTVEFKNGDRITRTRGSNNCNELFYIKNGEEHNSVLDTLSTMKNQQLRLNKEFGLDWDIFCGSVFFNQYGKPWLEMADQARKNAIERILHINKFAYYAKAAKASVDKIQARMDKFNNKLESLRQQHVTYTEQKTTFEVAASGFEDNQKARKVELAGLIDTETKMLENIERPDLERLEKKWEVVSKIEDMIKDLRVKSNRLSTQISEQEGHIEYIERTMQLWKTKSGKICTKCEQEIAATHVASKLDPLTVELEAHKEKARELEGEKGKIDKTIVKFQSALQDKKPAMTIYDAKSVITQIKRHEDSIKRFKKEYEDIDNESDPNRTSIQNIEQKLEEISRQIAELEKEREHIDHLSSYYSYIHKVYHDRNKLKSFVYQDHIPYINSRLSHYLDVFGLDIKVEITNTLSIASNMWGYDFESGGERKRTDVAFMLAMFDFHEAMYGRQCNVLVLDEVDGRMDDEGIDALINIIKEDLAPKIETVLIISHRNMMHDTFPKEIRVRRDNRFSYIH